MINRGLTWFPIVGYRRTQYLTSIGLFYKEVGRLWWEFVRVINIYTSQVIIIVDGVSTDHPL